MPRFHLGIHPIWKKKRLKRSKHPEAWQRRVLDGGFFALKLFRIIFQFWCFRILRYCLKDPRWNSSTFEHSSKIVVGCFIFEDYTAHSYWHGFFSQSKDPIMNRSQYFMECPRSGFCFRCSLTLPFRELTYPAQLGRSVAIKAQQQQHQSPSIIHHSSIPH